MVRAALLLLLAAPASAQPFVHASLSADLDGDGRPELAVVVGERDIGLGIWAEDPETYRTELLAYGPAMGWTQMGEDARLELTDAGSLRLTTSNYGIGRNKWEQVLTIAWRDGAFRVAGLTHSAFDSLDPEGGGRFCDLNLLTGNGASNYPHGGADHPVRVDAPAPRIEDWHPEQFTRLCGAGD